LLHEKKEKRERGQEKKKGLHPYKRHIYVKTVLQTNLHQDLVKSDFIP